MSLNVNGLCGYERCRKIFSKYFYGAANNSRPDIICCQETHVTCELEKDILVETNYDLCFANKTSRVGGLLVGFNKQLDYVVHKHTAYEIHDSQILVIQCDIQNKPLIICNCYIHPNDSVRQVTASFQDVLSEFVNKDVIICGDFNSSLDTHNIPLTNAEIARRGSQFSEFVSSINATDIWRAFNPDSNQYTHFTRSYSTRLDYILLNEGLINNVEKCSIGIAYKMDHCPIFLSLNFGRNPPGRGYWKFPKFLLKDKNYKQFLNVEIKQLIKENHGANPALLWDTVKCGIRGLTMCYIKHNRSSKKKTIENVETTIGEIYNLRSASIDFEAMDEMTADLKSLESLLDSLYVPMDGQIGNKLANSDTCSKYFLAKLAIPGSISMLINDQNEEVRDDKGINQICHQFCNNLYSKKSSITHPTYQFVPPTNYDRKLNEKQKEALEKEITKNELFLSLKKMKKNTSPGLDGMTVEFYEEFWEVVGDLVFNSLVYAHEVGQFSISQKRGVIKLIPKKNKNPHFVKNLRPITLLNVNLKLLTKTFALRFRTLMDEIIHGDQTAFIRKRFIGNNVLDIYSLMEAAEENNEEAVLILLDIEKAFDFVDWSFMREVFVKMEFPLYFISWLDAFQSGKELRIFNNGFSSDSINPQRGVAQGCSLSPLIFICAMEMLANVVRDNSVIQGIQCENQQKKIALAADDTMLSVTASQECLVEVNKVLDSFADVSGLKVNFGKSVIVRIGKNRECAPLECAQNFMWLNTEECFSYLGLKLVGKSSIPRTLNFIEDERFVEKSLQGTRNCKSSIIGKICRLKSLAASKLVYKFTLLPSPCSSFFKFTSKQFYDYVWDDGRHRISQAVMQQPLSNGGFSMHNVIYQENSLKLVWLQRCITNKSSLSFWLTHVQHCLIIPVKDLICSNIYPRGFHRFVKKG